MSYSSGVSENMFANLQLFKSLNGMNCVLANAESTIDFGIPRMFKSPFLGSTIVSDNFFIGVDGCSCLKRCICSAKCSCRDLKADNPL